jgi:predicted GNAT family acetyltransferase
MPASTPVTPVHDAGHERWTVALEGQLALLEYTVDGGVMTIRHTEVPEALGGRGIAGALVRAALDFARAEGYRVRPACEYAAAWMARHPDYQDLRAA